MIIKKASHGYDALLYDIRYVLKLKARADDAAVCGVVKSEAFPSSGRLKKSPQDRYWLRCQINAIPDMAHSYMISIGTIRIPASAVGSQLDAGTYSDQT